MARCRQKVWQKRHFVLANAKGLQICAFGGKSKSLRRIVSGETSTPGGVFTFTIQKRVGPTFNDGASVIQTSVAAKLECRNGTA